MSKLLLPNQAQPTDEMTQMLQFVMAIQAKVDHIQQQTVNCSFLLEFLIERMNTFAATGTLTDIHVSIEDYQTFHTGRMNELQAEWKKSMEQSLQKSTDLNLDE